MKNMSMVHLQNTVIVVMVDVVSVVELTVLSATIIPCVSSANVIYL